MTLVERRQCAAHSSRTGLPCKLPPIRGGTVCVTHGGRAPQVRAKAEERLRALKDPAVSVLEDLMAPTAPPALRFAAAKDVLDRNGVGRQKEPPPASVVFTLRIDRGDADGDAGR